jgi:ribosomal protein S18 acetylase RimI-like enzyme
MGVPRAYTIRKAEERHAAQIRLLIRELAASGGEKSPVTVKSILAYLRSPDSRILVAERDGTLLGMLSYSIRSSLFHAGESCTIEELVVSAEHRGRGIGGRLLSRAIREAEKRGCAEVSLSTEKDNARAISLYKKHGLTEEFLYLEKHFR